MQSLPPLALEALKHVRRREFDQALDAAKQALKQHSEDMGLQLFVGLLHVRRGELQQALLYLRSAAALAPQDPTCRLELARALIGLGQLDEADELLALDERPTREATKLRAMLESHRGNPGQVVQSLHQLVESDPADFESWGLLGLSLLTIGNARAAVAALTRSLQLKPDQPAILDKWVEAQVASGVSEQATAEAKAAFGLRSGDPFLAVAIARLEDLLGHPELALEGLEKAVDADPDNVPALTALAELFERLNRLDRLADVLDRLSLAAPDAEKLPLLRAELAFRRGDFGEALGFAESASALADPAARHQMIGKIHDRLEQSEDAWPAYSAMNQADMRANSAADARDYRGTVDSQAIAMTEHWANQWTVFDPPDSEPAFLVGFPRSGTTLLDTFLLGHPEVCVSEENPMLETVSQAAGPIDGLSGMELATVTGLRDRYFQEARGYVPEWGDRLLVDKLPFALIAGPLVHRLFPNAPIVFVERHPCDIVLSCFFTRFEPSGASANFLDLADTARLYDSMMRFWRRSCSLLPLRVHTVRYERLIEQTEAELRAVASFLGLEWSDALLDNRVTASRRSFIRTPSYAQVAEPVYARSVGRWTRYRDHLEPALPILEPWIEELGYDRL